MSVPLLLAHGDDGFGLDQVVARFAIAIGAEDRVEIMPERSPDEAAIDRARLESASVGLFGTRLAVLRQPLRAAGRSTAATDRLLALVQELPDGAALALVDVRSTREATRPPALLAKLATAVKARGGEVVERMAPRRGELQTWIRRHATELETDIEPRAAKPCSPSESAGLWPNRMSNAASRRASPTASCGSWPPTPDVGRSPSRTSRRWWPTRGRPASSPSPMPSTAANRQPPPTPSTGRWPTSQPVLRILGALQGRLSDLIVARDLAGTRRHAGGDHETGRTRQRPDGGAAGGGGAPLFGRELETMLIGLFETDLSIKTNVMEPEPALVAWLGEFVIGMPRERPAAVRR